MTYKVHIGYTARGRDRWRKFPTLADASRFCESVWQRRRVVLSIIGAP